LDLITRQFQSSSEFWKKLYSWANEYPFACVLDGNGFEVPFGSSFKKIAAVGSKEHKWADGRFFSSFSEIQKEKSVFGFLSYDLKNETEKLYSENPDPLQFPQALFFEPSAIIEEKNGEIEITASDPDLVFDQILNQKAFIPKLLDNISFSNAITKAEYFKSIESIKNLISDGLIYEINYCQFFESGQAFCGLSAFVTLKEIMPMPFSGWFKGKEFEIASASPERFLKKTSSKLLSQPMKGTAKRGLNSKEDQKQIESLLNSEKERAENLMIVDLVRNDLARVSDPGSTKVEELFGIYPFPTVFQMVSTVSSQLRKNKNWLDAISGSFPMGSMTGAPKIEVMKQIESLEIRKRGAFSGAMGHVNANEDFDFNVLIRSVFINHKVQKAGFGVGSAITIDSDADEEWQECKNKAGGLLKIFNNTWETAQR